MKQIIVVINRTGNKQFAGVFRTIARIISKENYNYEQHKGNVNTNKRKQISDPLNSKHVFVLNGQYSLDLNQSTGHFEFIIGLLPSQYCFRVVIYPKLFVFWSGKLEFVEHTLGVSTSAAAIFTFMNDCSDGGGGGERSGEISLATFWCDTAVGCKTVMPYIEIFYFYK